MIESAEWIGGRKWSLERDAEGARLQQGVTQLARLSPAGEKAQLLLVTAPQLWDAANELVKLVAAGREAMGTDELVRLANMVAKAVGKTEWKDVLQD